MRILKHTSSEGKIVFTPASVPEYAEFGEIFSAEESSEEEYLQVEAVGVNPCRKVSDFMVIVGGNVLGFTYAD